jgi:hypothetical protein
MGARSQLAAALTAAVDQVRVVPDLTSVESVDPALRGLLQLVRTTVEPASELLRFRSGFELWVAANNAALEQAEDALDDILDDVIVALDSFGWLTWSTAQRDVHPGSNLPAYKITLTTTLKGV